MGATPSLCLLVCAAAAATGATCEPQVALVGPGAGALTMSWRSHGTDNRSMVRALVRNDIVKHESVAAAMTGTDRGDFVADQRVAYVDAPQYIGATISGGKRHVRLAVSRAHPLLPLLRVRRLRRHHIRATHGMFAAAWHKTLRRLTQVCLPLCCSTRSRSRTLQVTWSLVPRRLMWGPDQAICR